MDGSADWLINVFITLLGLDLLGYCQCHLWPYNPIHTCLHVITTCMFICVRINTITMMTALCGNSSTSSTSIIMALFQVNEYQLVVFFLPPVLEENLSGVKCPSCHPTTRSEHRTEHKAQTNRKKSPAGLILSYRMTCFRRLSLSTVSGVVMGHNLTPEKRDNNHAPP